MHLKDLGPLLVEVEGRDVELGAGKMTMILATLALHANRRVPVDVLVDAVWGAASTADRAGTLESHIWRLRKIIEPGRRPRQPPQVLVNDSSGYRLLALSDEMDSARFEQMADETRDLLLAGDFHRTVRMADDALALWRGAPYEMLADRAIAEPTIARLTEARRQLCGRRVDALLESGAHAQALQDLGALLAAAPFDEHLWAARMLALHRLGRTQEALQSYRDARANLRDEVGIEPGDELTSLHSRVLAADPTLTRSERGDVHLAPVPIAAVPVMAEVDDAAIYGRYELATAERPVSPHPHPDASRPPTSLTPLIGRGETLTQLAPLVATYPLVTVTGPAGCGKTRLAIELSRDLGGEYRDGVWFIDLASVHEPSLVPAIVLSTVGVSPAAAGTPLDGLRAYCRDRTILLVLDNCEHVLDVARTVAEAVVTTSRNSRILTTSREPLGIDGEVLWTLGPLSLPGRAHNGGQVPGGDESADRQLHEMMKAPAVELFLTRMSAADPTRTVTSDDVFLVAQICRALDGLPLAIELAAARIRSATLREIAAQVAKDPTELRRLGRSGLGEQITLRDTIDAGYRLLTEPEQAVHRRLAVLAGRFTGDVAAAVASDDVSGPFTKPDVIYLLDSLVRRSLLTTVPAAHASSPTMFRQLMTVRGHAVHVLRAAGEEAGAAQRRDAWVADFIGRRPRFAHRDLAGWYPSTVDALSTVRAALEHTVIDAPTTAGAHHVARLTMFWYFRSQLAEGQRWGDLAVDAARDDPITAIFLQLARAAGDAIRGRADLAVPSIDAALTRLADAAPSEHSPDRLIDIGDLHAPLAIALAPAGQAPTVAALSRSAAQLSHLTGDPGLNILADALSCAAQARSRDPQATVTRNAELYEKALNAGHLFAAVLTAGTNVALALAARDPKGRVWAERSHQLHRDQGGTQNGLLLESSGNFSAFAGDPLIALRQLSASQAAARRAGTIWPRHPITGSTMAHLQRSVTRVDFDRAWREGRIVGPLTAARPDR